MKLYTVYPQDASYILLTLDEGVFNSSLDGTICSERSSGSAYFFWYWLSKEEFTEHGGSVPGWLTDKGCVLLEAINRSLTLT